MVQGTILSTTYSLRLCPTSTVFEMWRDDVGTFNTVRVCKKCYKTHTIMFRKHICATDAFLIILNSGLSDAAGYPWRNNVRN